ncbi:MGDG synthase family glycosyltransferase [Paenibacillus monticola]|uniref:Glycosyltransferase n=1 Tax=Paenibacillus monticola TaxID=2666075 RepID=A0A7X2L2B0_9BACL|nr:glycosyltransferase [Paenibacillus monticola]MRN53181.1 glycosyltransferase [Paenibacillus monticola]
MKVKKYEKILILSGTLGDGHMQAARAMLEASALYRPGMVVEVVDFMSWIHPYMHTFERYCFLLWVKHFPSLYGYMFQKTRRDNSLSRLLKQLRSFSIQRMVTLLQEANPTLLVSTFPPAAAAISLLKAKGLIDVPAVTVITDHTDHSYWIHPHTDLYLVGSERVRLALQRRGISKTIITVTGIPVRPAYNQTLDKRKLRVKNGLSPKVFIVLVMGGGEGIINKSFIDQVNSETLPPDIHFNIICGRNEKLMKRLQGEFQNRPNVQIKGYVEDIHEWMAMADVLITKPGGLTTSEALASRLPMLLFQPQYGQERDNADYLISAGAAWELGICQLQSQLQQLLNNQEILSEMKEAARKLMHKDSARLAINEILNVQQHALNEKWDSPEQHLAFI